MGWNLRADEALSAPASVATMPVTGALAVFASALLMFHGSEFYLAAVFQREELGWSCKPSPEEMYMHPYAFVLSL